MLVIDANVALEACGQEDGFQTLGDDLAAPPLMWSEARANLHLSLINGEITAQDTADPGGNGTYSGRPDTDGMRLPGRLVKAAPDLSHQSRLRGRGATGL